MNNKTIFILSLILLSAMSLSVLYAETDDVTTEGNIVTVHGEKFNIPEGFKVDETNKTVNYTECDLVNKKTNEVIIITVYFDEEYNDLTHLSGYEEKTIKGHTGDFKDSGKTAQFVYIDNKYEKLITADNEDLINKVII